MIFLFVLIVFFGSTDKEPATAMIEAPSAEACAAKADELKLKATADPEVSGYVIECRAVPIKA